MKKHIYTKTFSAEGIRLVYINQYVPLLQNEDWLLNKSFHVHEYYELFWCNSEGFDICFTEDRLTIREGEFMLIPPGIYHYSTVEQSSDAMVICFAAEIVDSDCMIPFLQLLHRKQYTHWKQDEDYRMLIGLLRKAQEEERLSEVSIYLYALLSHAMVLLEPRQEELHSLLWDDSISRLYKIDMIINRYYQNDIPLETLAAYLNISIRQLSRIIKKQYGCTYTEKILQMRMEEALKLLRSGKSIAETAAETGYHSVRSFREACKKYYGKVPREMGNERDGDSGRDVL